jgi:hypothetical protein
MARLAALLDAWDAWEVDQVLPPAERRLERPPEGGREALSVLHRALLDELHDLDGPPSPEPSAPHVTATAPAAGVAPVPTDAVQQRPTSG